MLEILQFYVSGFLPWLGMTIGLLIVVEGLTNITKAIVQSWDHS